MTAAAQVPPPREAQVPSPREAQVPSPREAGRGPGRGVRGATAAIAIAFTGCTGVATSIGGRPGPEAGLLRGKIPLRSAGVSHVDRLRSPDAFVVYDLGAETPVDCAAIEADADDTYALALSADGVAFTPLWTLPPAPDDAGMQPRAVRDLHSTGRYLRLSAAGGDGIYAVAELSLAAECPPRWPPVLAPQRGAPIDRSAATKAWLFAALGAAYVLGYRRKLPDFLKLLIAAPLGIGLALVFQLADIWPPPRSLLLPLTAAPLIVAAAFAVRMVARRGRDARSPRT